MKKVLLMSLYDPQLEMSPGKYQILDELKDRGFETYVFLPGTLKNEESYSSINHVINVKGMQDKDIRRKIVDINPQVVIATTFKDAIVLYSLPRQMKNTSFYYYNLEIYTPYLHKDIRRDNFSYYVKYKLKYPLNKLREVLYTRNVKAFNIQDELRAKVSAKYYIRHSNTMFIPNSYFFDESQIVSAGQKGVIYTGGIKRDFLLGQFDDLETVKNVPITFSGRIDQWCKQRIEKLNKTNPNIKFEEHILPINEYTNYIRQYAVGLVWYSPLRKDEARYYMGLSSGKMFKHLSIGQPVIVIGCPGADEAVEKYKLGVVINNITELESAYSKIMDNYSYYMDNVIRTYRDVFDFKKVVTPFLDYIESNLAIGEE